jgi:hypothetical protein
MLLADEMAITSSPGSLVSSQSNQSLGWEFNVNQTIDVTGLEWYDPDGTTDTVARYVGIFDNTGALIVDACVGPGCDGSSWSSGYWTTAASAILSPDTGYEITGFLNSGDPVATPALGDVTTIPEITLDKGVYGQGYGSYATPAYVPFTSNDAFLAPNFTVADTPEPGPSIMIPIGIGIFAVSTPLLKKRRESPTAGDCADPEIP